MQARPPFLCVRYDPRHGVDCFMVGARASLAHLRVCVLPCVLGSCGRATTRSGTRTSSARTPRRSPLLAPAPLAHRVATLHAAFAAAVGGDGDNASTRPFRLQPVARPSESALCPPPLPPSCPSASSSGGSSGTSSGGGSGGGGAPKGGEARRLTWATI